MEPLIRYAGVWKRFGGRAVLAGVDLAVARREIVALLGPSGTGKTVLLKLLVGLLRPDEGSVIFDGVDVARLDERRLGSVRRQIGFVFQGSALFDSLSVAENVGYPLRVAGERSREAIAARVAECLALVGLPNAGPLAPAELSGGMRKRVAVARALATRPEALLYDEPTVGLDPANLRLVGHLIGDLRARLGATALVVTHDRELALGVADRLVLLSDGKILWSGPAAAARRAPPPPLAAFFGPELAP